ncbi:MAG: RNA 3'-terminal phosphate cyclase [Nitrospirae bacterium]|nr:RNA 3'-terminal phosphate cyclase [Nitrospirota bacterium]
MPVSYMAIDGSHGEGGGQILRSALSLAIILSKPVEIINIRRGRPKSGLRPQHLTCVNACRDISDAHVEGNEIGSAQLRFSPQVTKSGNFTFNVAEKRGSAGSTSLILQTLLPPLVLGQHTTQLTLMGGTHGPWSPPFHYLKEIFIPVIGRMGVSIELTIDKWGWYPIGGGIVHAEINPIIPLNPPLPPLLKGGKVGLGEKGGLKGLIVEERGRLTRIWGLSAVSNLPLAIAERQRSEGLKELKALTIDTDIEVISAPSPGKGTFFFIVAEYAGIKAGFSALGAIGKPAEEVAREACRAFFEYHDSNGAVEPHLADQLIPYMALADGASSFTTTKVTRHLLTNVWTVRQLMDVDIRVKGREGECGRVTRV